MPNRKAVRRLIAHFSGPEDPHELAALAPRRLDDHIAPPICGSKLGRRGNFRPAWNRKAKSFEDLVLPDFPRANGETMAQALATPRLKQFVHPIHLDRHRRPRCDPQPAGGHLECRARPEYECADIWGDPLNAPCHLTKIVNRPCVRVAIEGEIDDALRHRLGLINTIRQYMTRVTIAISPAIGIRVGRSSVWTEDQELRTAVSGRGAEARKR